MTRSTQRRLCALALTASAAASPILPASASAAPIYDTGFGAGTETQEVRPVAPSDSPSLFVPLAGGALAMVLTGAGYVAFRFARPRTIRSAGLEI